MHAHLQHGLRAGRMAVADEDQAQAQRSKASDLHGHVVVRQQRRQQLPDLLLARACPRMRLNDQSEQTGMVVPCTPTAHGKHLVGVHLSACFVPLKP